MHDFNPLQDIFGPIILIVILLIGYGVMSGTKSKALVSAFLDLVVSLLRVGVIAAAKILPPVLTGLINGLTLLSKKTKEALIKAIEHKPDSLQQTQKQQTPPAVTAQTEPTAVEEPKQEAPPQTPPNKPVVTGSKKVHNSTSPKKPVANPYEEDPEIDIIEN